MAHKVRGLPAFDIAIHMTCPACEATNDHCPSCDGVGHWWIIPTSGHRAYPIISWPMSALNSTASEIPLNEIIDMTNDHIRTHSNWPSLRDHYTSEAETARSLIDTLGLKATTLPTQPILRRL